MPNDNIPPYPGEDNGDTYAPCLTIYDGVPWYASDHIWTVPGNNPKSLPGPPVAGGQNWVWVRVWNLGNAPIFNATVNFYWTDPSTLITRQNAHLIGSETISIQANQYAHVCCQTPWVPGIVNQGHACLIVEAYEPLLDPLLNPASSDFNVTVDRHVAQRNVILAINAAGLPLVFPITIVNPVAGAAQAVQISVERFPVTNLTGLAMNPGLAPLMEISQDATAEVLGRRMELGNPHGFTEALTASFEATLGGGAFDWRPRNAAAPVVEEAVARLRGVAAPVARLEIPAHGLEKLAVVTPPLPDARPGQACAYCVTQTVNGMELGGVLIIILADPPPVLTAQQRRFMLLEQALTARPDLVHRLLDQPGQVLEELGMDWDDLRCPEQVTPVFEKAERAAAAARELENLPLEQQLPRLRRIAERYLGPNWQVEKKPFGLRFLEQAQGSSNMDWTGTATFECTFHPGCGADFDG